MIEVKDCTGDEIHEVDIALPADVGKWAEEQAALRGIPVGDFVRDIALEHAAANAKARKAAGKLGES